MRTPYQRRLSAENAMETIHSFAEHLTDGELNDLIRIATVLDARIPDVEDDE